MGMGNGEPDLGPRPDKAAKRRADTWVGVISNPRITTEDATGRLMGEGNHPGVSGRFSLKDGRAWKT